MGRLTGCCGCFNLRDGSRAIGITLLVLSSLELVFLIARATLMSQHLNSHMQHMDSGLVVEIVGLLAVCILHLLMNALLVHGVNKNSRGMLLAWIIYSGIIYGLESLALAMLFVFACICGIWWVFLLVLAISGLVGVKWYWFVVVLHCYQEMHDENGFVYGKQESEDENHAL